MGLGERNSSQPLLRLRGNQTRSCFPSIIRDAPTRDWMQVYEHKGEDPD